MTATQWEQYLEAYNLFVRCLTILLVVDLKNLWKHSVSCIVLQLFRVV